MSKSLIQQTAIQIQLRVAFDVLDLQGKSHKKKVEMSHNTIKWLEYVEERKITEEDFKLLNELMDSLELLKQVNTTCDNAKDISIVGKKLANAINEYFIQLKQINN
jgi:hypothetical protein